MAQSNQDISYNNSLANVETKLNTVITNTQDDFASVAIQICDVPGVGNPTPIMMVGHFKSAVLQSVEYRNLAGGVHTVTGTLANCTGTAGGGAPDYTTVLGNISTNTNSTNSNVANVVSTLGSTNTSLSSIDTGIAAINTKLNQTCAGTPIKVSVCNPTTVDFTSTNSLLTTGNTNTSSINTGVGDVNTKLTSALTKIDTTNTQLSSINSKLNQSCAGTPLNVFVCNQPSSFVDFTATNAILTDIKNLTTTIRDNSNSLVTNSTSTNTKLDTANGSLTTIANVLSQSCAGTPLKVEVCNPASGGTDMTATNTILTSIDTKSSTLITNTGNTVSGITSTNTKLDTANTNLTNIYNKLNASCGSSPININVCNQLDLGPMQTSLSSIDSKQSTLVTNSNTAVTSLGTIVTNTGNTANNTATIASSTTSIATSNSAIATNTANTNTSVTSVNTNITSLKTQLTTANTNHVVVDNLPSIPLSYNTNEMLVVGTPYGTTTNTFAGGVYHSITVHVIIGTATITVGSYSFVAPTGTEITWLATNFLANAIIVTCTTSDQVVITSMR